MYKKDLALNNQQRLICHKNQPNQTKPYIYIYISKFFFFFSFFFFESSIEQVLATTPHETPTIQTLAPHNENYTS